MIRLATAALALGLPTCALAQIVETPVRIPGGAVLVAPASPDVTGSLGAPDKSGPGAVEVVPGRTGASTLESDSAAGANAEQTTRPVPQYGRNGGNGSGGGGQ
ncbi:hypothetical protein M446_2763 [Methylobacterium sp. 4-46]|uniref:hypothetical protein n=1 Tax=unclassified Methylobacterium TaxID=2615210 RepID=UPI000165C841|nr:MULTISPECIES: hypothetical protein [Methylobacterium]ACA17201.1 hypothetical protein M446_2763 [Methylobacterium sp. 4-46]WFT82883.1 hypothetical protein QA634_14000 [Methylobacterium nodulans]